MHACISCPIDSPPPIHTLNARQALSLLNKCTTTRGLTQIHAHIIKTKLTHDYVLITKLLNLYSSHKRMHCATEIFNQNQTHLTFTWNIMIRAHTKNNTPQEALLLYNLMLEKTIPPDKFTFPFAIKACIDCSEIQKGREIHGHAIKTGFYSDIFVKHTLMDLYFKCGDSDSGHQVFDEMPVRNVVSWTTLVAGLIACGEFDTARDVFDKMPMRMRNVVSWTAMINGCVRNGEAHEAFRLFHRMLAQNVSPNEYTLVGLLLACVELGSLKLGSWVHDFTRKNGFGLGVFLGTALVDMYSKCGSLDNAIKVFDKMPERSLSTWNCMITSLGVHGRGREALAVFGEMEREKVKPDGITFIGVLCACVHAGMVDEGYGYFECMKKEYGIAPTMEHYSVMVDILCHVGRLDEALEFVQSMAIEPSVEIWRALLSACKDQESVELEKIVAKQFIEIDPLEGSELCTSIKQEQQHLCFKWEVG